MKDLDVLNLVEQKDNVNLELTVFAWVYLG